MSDISKEEGHQSVRVDYKSGLSLPTTLHLSKIFLEEIASVSIPTAKERESPRYDISETYTRSQGQLDAVLVII